ncbi:RAP domain-containing protein, partial [Haematococcus lacustris]
PCLQLPSAVSITNLVWAATSLGYRDPPLFAALARAALLRQVEWEGARLSTLLWGYASWGFYDRPLMEALAAKAARSLLHLELDDLSRPKH